MGGFCRISQLFRTQFNQVLLLWEAILFGKKSKPTRGQSVTCKLEIIRRYNIRAPPARCTTFPDTSMTWQWHPIMSMLMWCDNLQLPIFKIGRLCLNQMCHPAFCILNRSTLFTPGFSVPSTYRTGEQETAIQPQSVCRGLAQPRCLKCFALWCHH